MTNDSRLARRLDLKDAVWLGLGSMIGAGIFAVAAPAAQAAGTGLLIAVLIAGTIAFLNAVTMSQLASVYPQSGGTYVYGRMLLGNFWGFLAGWGFVIGKFASCTAVALTFANYLAPDYPKPYAIGAVLLLTFVNYLGVKKTASVTRLIVIAVLFILSILVASSLAGGGVELDRLTKFSEWKGLNGTLQAAGLMFFAFAGYARVATLGEEVVEPQKTIPKAIIIAFGITLSLYLLILGTALITVDIESLADSNAPLVLAVESGDFAFISRIVRVGACLASIGVLLSLMAGVSRTIFSMAANSDLPNVLAAVHPKNKVPHRAEIIVGLIVSTLLLFADLRGAIGFSSFAILLYYAIANIASLKLPQAQRSWPKWMSIAGVLGCLLLAVMLPAESVIGGLILFVIGSLIYLASKR